MRCGTDSTRRALAGADVLLVGLFSTKDTDLNRKLNVLAAAVEAHGARVVGRHVQRRGVSHGGVRKMTDPFSRRTLLSTGKGHEVAEACRSSGVRAVVFANPLTEQQRTVLGEMFGCIVLSGEDATVNVLICSRVRRAALHRGDQWTSHWCCRAPQGTAGGRASMLQCGHIGRVHG